MRGESRRARPLTATAGARAGCPWSRRPQRRVLRPPLLVHRWVLAPPAFPSGCAVPQGPPPSTWRPRSGRASCESATPRRSRRRGSCSHRRIAPLSAQRANCHQDAQQLDAHASAPCGIQVVHEREAALAHRRSHLYLCVAPRAASLAGGGASRRGLPAAAPARRIYLYAIFDLSVTKG